MVSLVLEVCCEAAWRHVLMGCCYCVGLYSVGSLREEGASLSPHLAGRVMFLLLLDLQVQGWPLPPYQNWEWRSKNIQLKTDIIKCQRKFKLNASWPQSKNPPGMVRTLPAIATTAATAAIADEWNVRYRRLSPLSYTYLRWAAPISDLWSQPYGPMMPICILVNYLYHFFKIFTIAPWSPMGFLSMWLEHCHRRSISMFIYYKSIRS